MKILVWNCRGLASPRAVRSLKDVLSSCKPDIVGLIETKLSSRRCKDLRCKIGYYGCLPVGCRGKSGGLAVLWKEEVIIDIKNYSNYHIDMTVNFSIPFRFTLFYGQPNSNKRIQSWNLLSTLSNLASFPWLVSGDFNEITHIGESSNGNRSNILMSNFRSALNVCDLSDLGFHGPPFTFSNKRKGIDEAKARLSWRVAFPKAKVFHLTALSSDHNPVLTDVDYKLQTNLTQKRFHFEHMWLRQYGFHNLISGTWDRLSTENSSLATNLKSLGSTLTTWNQSSFGNVSHKINCIRSKLTTIRNLPRDSSTISAEDTLSRELDEWLLREEILWKQRSRADWMREGDSNTKFFHRRASVRKRTNKIIWLEDTNGNLYQDESSFGPIFLDYFQHLFKSDLNSSPTDWNTVLHFIPKKVSTVNYEGLSQAYTEEEVRFATFQINPCKAPGRDGFSGLFFQKFWDKIKTQVVYEILNFLNGGDLD